MITDLQKPPFDKPVSFIKLFDADGADANHPGHKGECGDDCVSHSGKKKGKCDIDDSRYVTLI